MSLNSIYPNPVTIGTAEPGLDIPVNDWWKIKAGIGRAGAWQGAYDRLLDRWFFDEAPELSAEQATKTYGIDGVLKFDQPVLESAAKDRRERTVDEIRRSLLTDSARHNWYSWKGVSGFGAMIAGQMFNANGPANIDFGLSVFPFFGGEKAAAGAAATGWRGALNVQKGFLPVPFITKYPILAESVLNGATSSAVGEIASYLDARYTQEETHYLANVAMGTAGAGAFHLGVRGLLKGLDASGRALRRLTPDTTDAAARIAELQAARGDDIRPLDHAPTDENVIRLATIPENAANATELLILSRLEATQTGPSAKIAARLLERFAEGERTVDLFDQMAQLLDRKYRPDKPGVADESFLSQANRKEKPLREELYQIEQVAADLAKRLHTAEPLLARQLRSNLHNLQLRRAEIVSVLEKGEASTPLTPDELAAHRAIIEARPENLAAAAAARGERVLEYTQKNDPAVLKKQERDASNRAAAESARHTDAPESDRWVGDDDADKALANITEDVTNLERELKASDPEAFAAIEKQFDTAAKGVKNIEAAEKAAIDCMLKNGVS